MKVKLDDALVREAQRLTGLPTPQAAVEFCVRQIVADQQRQEDLINSLMDGANSGDRES